MSHAYLPYLAFNVAVEVAGALAVFASLRRLLPGTAGVPSLARLAMVVVAVNLVTHPVFWFGLPHLPITYGPKLIGAEVLVFLVEGATYATIGRVRPVALAFGLSAVANALSWFGGEWWLG